jgi:hypothetical protein
VNNPIVIDSRIHNMQAVRKRRFASSIEKAGAVVISRNENLTGTNLQVRTQHFPLGGGGGSGAGPVATYNLIVKNLL